MLDEPALSDVRRLISRPFKPVQARALALDVRKMSDDVLQDMLADDHRSLDVGAYSNEVHFRMMALIMGVDEDLAPVFREWMRVFNESDSLATLNRQPDIRRRLGSLLSKAEAAERDGVAAAGLLGELAREHLAGTKIGTSRLRKSDVISLLWSVIAAGTDTPGTAATATVYFTLQTNDFRDLADIDRARAAEAEALRFYPPFPKPLMQVSRDCTIGGSHLTKNQWVEVHLPAANRDERMFSRPHEFDIDRPDAKNARPFGDLPHYCIGSHYGLMVGAQVISSLATAVPKSGVAAGAPCLPSAHRTVAPLRQHAGGHQSLTGRSGSAVTGSMPARLLAGQEAGRLVVEPDRDH